MNFYITDNFSFIPLDLGGGQWSFSFDIIEMIVPSQDLLQRKFITLENIPIVINDNNGTNTDNKKQAEQKSDAP
jgi:hypothetical protein